MNNPYRELETENGEFALFINSMEQPDKEIPMNHYYYMEDYSGRINKCRFFRLHRIEWIRYGMGTFSLLDWIEIEVKERCKPALKQLCDSMVCMDEFLLPPGSGG